MANKHKFSSHANVRDKGEPPKYRAFQVKRLAKNQREQATHRVPLHPSTRLNEERRSLFHEENKGMFDMLPHLVLHFSLVSPHFAPPWDGQCHAQLFSMIYPLEQLKGHVFHWGDGTRMFLVPSACRWQVGKFPWNKVAVSCFEANPVIMWRAFLPSSIKLIVSWQTYPFLGTLLRLDITPFCSCTKFLFLEFFDLLESSLLRRPQQYIHNNTFIHRSTRNSIVLEITGNNFCHCSKPFILLPFRTLFYCIR